jgi:hypothetical protein
MTTAHDYKSGKGDKDENFPVASVLVAPRFRAPISARAMPTRWARSSSTW